MELRTNGGGNVMKRPDLLSVIKEVLNPPTGYIGSRIFPITKTVDKSGVMYYQELTTDSAAVTNRSAGTAPATVLVGTASSTFACTETIKRYGVTEDEVKELGGIESADKLGAKGAVRSVMRSYEDACAAALIDGQGTLLTASNVLTGIQKAALNVRRYPGKLKLVCSNDWFLDLLGQTDVAAKILGTLPNPSAAPLDALFAMQPEAIARYMATLMKVDEIVLGDNDHWKVTGKEDVAALVKLIPGVNPTEDEIRAAYKLDPMYGVTKWFIPDPVSVETPVDLDSWYNPDALVNTYTARIWVNVKQLNAGAKTLIRLPAQTYATTTTHT